MTMQTIETTAHVGSDGILRVEAPVAIKNQDVCVVLVIQRVSNEARPGARKKRAAEAAKEKERIHPNLAFLRTSGWVPDPYEPLVLPGPSASETLVNDRR